MRIAGTNIPDNKRLIISLTYIRGIGPKRSNDICEKLKLDKSKRVKDLTNEEQNAILDVLGEYTLEADLRRQVSQNIKRLQDIGSYRGYRHRRRLPVRGQRTKTSARTRKGKATAIAGKKKVSK